MAWTAGIKSEPDSTFSQTDMPDTTLGTFLSRPVRGNPISWNINQNLNITFNPWAEFFGNKRVANRISNYNLLRCTLKVKFLLTGSSFHYGKILASYNPLHLGDEVGVTTPNNGKVQNLIQYSQRSHIVLDASSSQGGILTLPFFHPANALVVPIAEWGVMGEIYFNSFCPLKHANAGTTGIDITYFIWAEDVQLSMPTNVNSGGLVAQATGDEYVGPVSSISNIVARMAGKLINVPMIGPYAFATQEVAGAVSSVARMFGFSRPIQLELGKPTVPMMFNNTANTNVHDIAHKLSLDVRQETTVDPRVVGLDGTDEMALKYITSRESYLTQFVWPIGTARETLLWTTHVNPLAYDISAFPVAVGPAKSGIHLTSLGFAALPFRYWRGTINYRFMVIASPYHRGRLTIRYDPRNFQNVNDGEYNLNYLHILDLEKDRDFTLKVGWSQSFSYLPLEPISENIPSMGATRRIFLPQMNGVVEVLVHNVLTSPNTVTNNDIRVCVFVSAGDDFELCSPDENNLERLTPFVPQASGTIPLPTTIDNPEISEVDYEVGSTKSADMLAAIHHGDPVTSFRQCLKRYGLSTFYTDNTNDFSLFTLIQSDFPQVRGDAPDALFEVFPGVTPPNPRRWNYTNMTLLNYVTLAYVARRGGLRHMYVFPHVREDYNGLTTIDRLARNATFTITTEAVPSAVNPAPAALNLRRFFLRRYPNMWNGCTLITTKTQQSVTVELPYTNNRRFVSGRKVRFTTPSEGLTSHRLVHYSRTDSESTSRNAIVDMVSVAEDFQLSYFIGPPVFFLAATP